LYDVESNGYPIPTFNFISAPQGMTINPTSGLIEWVPVNNGEFVVEIQAENAAGSDSQEFTLMVVQPPISADNFIYLPVTQK
jgi:hypothetical protein